MKHLMTLFIEQKRMTEMMRKLDLFHDKKFLVSGTNVEFKTSTPVNEEYFMNFINKSKSSDDMRILAIQYMDNLYCDDDVVELSDGECSIFVRPLK